MTVTTSDTTQKKSRLWWFPSVEVLIFIIVFLISLFVMPNLINSDGDLGRHITIGEVLLDTRAMLHEDIFSHTMLGEELILHEWLSDLIFALVYRVAGIDGIPRTGRNRQQGRVVARPRAFAAHPLEIREGAKPLHVCP